MLDRVCVSMYVCVSVSIGVCMSICIRLSVSVWWVCFLGLSLYLCLPAFVCFRLSNLSANMYTCLPHKNPLPFLQFLYRRTVVSDWITGRVNQLLVLYQFMTSDTSLQSLLQLKLHLGGIGGYRIPILLWHQHPSVDGLRCHYFRRSRRRSSLSPTKRGQWRNACSTSSINGHKLGMRSHRPTRDGVGIHSSTHVPANGSDNDPHLRIALDPHRDIRSKMESPPSNEW